MYRKVVNPTVAVRTATRPMSALAVLATAQFAVTLSTSIVNVALPSIRDGVGLSDTGLTWVVNAYGLTFGALLLLGGRAADLLGRRRVLLAGLALFAGAAVAAGLATTPWLLISARAAQGIGAAAVAPASLALVMGLFPAGPGRGRALGAWGTVTGAGGAAGVLLGGVLTQSLGWPWVFLTSALFAVAVLVATVALVPELPAPRNRICLDLPGAVAVTAGLVALVYGLGAAARTGWGGSEVLAAVAFAAALLAAFVLAERRHPAPLIPPRLFSSRQVVVANAVMAAVGSVWVGLFFFLPLYQQRVLGYDPLVTGLSQLPLAAANMIGSALTPRLARRIGPTPTLLVGLFALAIGFLWLAGVSAHGTFATDLLGPMIVLGIGLGISFVRLTDAAVTGVRSEDGGLASGLVNTSRQIGGAVGLAVLGTFAAARTAASGADHNPLVALTEGYRTAFLVSAALVAAAAMLAPVLARARITPGDPRRRWRATRSTGKASDEPTTKEI
ncbi:MFS transporter [Rhodococcus hoagii]|nr:MFS transporter [Prescottella equi]NKR80571.1 MFS transporter [Prescottella equi]NKS99495.1 MFS transporter [Prescottella equi]